MLSEHNAVVFKVANDATKPQIKAAVEALFKVNVTGVNTLNAEGQDQALEGSPLHALGRQEGDRDAGRRPDASTSPPVFGAQVDGTQDI